jgi:hypothetical protein
MNDMIEWLIVSIRLWTYPIISFVDFSFDTVSEK